MPPEYVLRDSVGGSGELEALEQLAGTARASLRRLVEEPPDVLEVLVPGEAFVDRGVLTGEPDPRPGSPRVLHDVDAVDERRGRRRASAAW